MYIAFERDNDTRGRREEMGRHLDCEWRYFCMVFIKRGMIREVRVQDRDYESELTLTF